MIYIILKDKERNFMKLVKEIFREYDIRGIYNEDMDEETAYYIGAAYGTKLLSLGKSEAVVAYDNRLSSPILEENLVKGLSSTGVNVLRLGLATTPMCYFAANYCISARYLNYHGISKNNS